MFLKASVSDSLNDWSENFSALSVSDGDLQKYAAIKPVSKKIEKMNKV